MRLIDADRLKDSIMFTCDLGGWIGETLLQIKKVAVKYIENAPTIDAVEVVRCGRCEWWKCNPNTEEYGVCKKVSYDDFEVVMDSDDFCSYGSKMAVRKNDRNNKVE